MSSPSLQVRFCNLDFSNPTVLASGILGINAQQLKRVAEAGACGLTLKSIGPKPRLGHNNPVILPYEHYMLNAVGLPTPGYKHMDEKWEELESLKKNSILIASIYGGNIEEFVEVAAHVAKKSPHMIELNLSCPNSDEHGTAFANNLDVVKEVVSKVKSVSKNIPIMPKLSPNVMDIAEVAKTCEKSGADAICAINTLGPGMAIDISSRKPILAYKKGGLSGPALKPIAVRCVYDIHASTKLPILGMGGITTGEDAIEMMMAGSTLVGIGSGVYYRGIDVFRKICDEMQQWMVKNNITDLQQIIGAAHRQ